MRLQTPLTENVIRRLRVGEGVELSGTLVTARDKAHKFLGDGGRTPADLNVIYHCGPIVSEGMVISAGPTTSVREEAYEADVIRRFGVRAVIGKGGMGERTLEALGDCGCVYLAAVGGAGALIAARVKEIKGVHMLREFGASEAMWVFEVERLPLTVAMDTHGESVYRDVESESERVLRALIR
jgi:tartrate/fumarate subfamily iron-sulfur-dependent hydro-lyase beta chain